MSRCTTKEMHHSSHSANASEKQARGSVPTRVHLAAQRCFAANARSAKMPCYNVTRRALPSALFCPPAKGERCTGYTKGARHALRPVLSAGQRAPALKVVPCSSVTALCLAKTRVVHHLCVRCSDRRTTCKRGHTVEALRRAHQPGRPAHRQQCAALGER